MSGLLRSRCDADGVINPAGLALLRGSRAESAARRAAAAEPRERAEGAPRAVTRGESCDEGQVPSAAKVDWLNATFDGPKSRTPVQFVHLLSKVIGFPMQGLEQHGMFGFERSVKLFAFVGSRRFPVGALAWGGESQKGRWMLQFTGGGCSLVGESWNNVRRLLLALDARITRLDLAVDYLAGEYTVDDAVRMHRDGGFTSGGRAPSTSVAGDWIEGRDGRTLYVGKATNGKMLRAYEKGIQMGELDSKWVRFEVQFGNRDRVIPLDALVMRDAFFAGAYPALQEMLGVAAERIETSQTGGCVSVEHLMFHLTRSYGKLFGVLSDELKATASELIEAVSVSGVPRRLSPAAVTCGLTWDKLKESMARISRIKQ